MIEEQNSDRFPDALLVGHERFVRECFAAKEDLFSRLASEGQFPKTMWIGCSDSRLPPETLVGADPGELFVLRNVANIVPPVDADESSVGSALWYAVTQLRVENIVVCGHSDCGGMKALSKLGSQSIDNMLSSWIEYATPALEDDGGGDLESLTKTNVLAQIERLREYACVAEAEKSGQLSLQACYFKIASGQLERFDARKREWLALV